MAIWYDWFYLIYCNLLISHFLILLINYCPFELLLPIFIEMKGLFAGWNLYFELILFYTSNWLNHVDPNPLNQFNTLGNLSLDYLPQEQRYIQDFPRPSLVPHGLFQLGQCHKSFNQCQRLHSQRWWLRPYLYRWEKKLWSR